MRPRQTGITAISFLALAVILALLGFAALKLMPIYLEHMKVVSVLKDIKTEFDHQNPSIRLVRSAIGKRLSIEMVTVLKPQDFKIRKTENGLEVRAQYENRTPYLGNLYFLAIFNEAVVIER
ncbi:MAG: DUF4845 domain-containing protein [Gammaproteobacteria bacterium]|nr:MAG: DUF4845 domain-containing protein [Gammaproteobacteria bacterium]